MDFEKWVRHKAESISEKISNSALKRDKVQMLTSAAKAVAILYVLYIVLSAFVYPAFLYYFVYKPIASDHIDAYLNKTSETILLESTNNTEIADNIVSWERNEFIFKSGIFDSVLDPFGYRIPKNAGWYIYLNKGNCGERATIFNDMANRSGLSYRKIVVDGFINSKYNSSSDHSWSEILLEDGSWVIADSGFNISPLHRNKSVFCNDYNLLLGPVFVYENLTNVLDCTEEYVENTEKLKIKVVRNGKTIDNASIKVTMNYNGVSKLVAGGIARFIKFETNESGISEMTLGVYDNVSYTLKAVESKGIYQYEGETDVVLGNNTEKVKIEANKLRPNTGTFVFLMLIFLYAGFLKKLVSRKKCKTKEREKL